MRTFIAIEISTEVKSAVAAVQNELSRAEADIAWINSEDIHLTLKFLGEIDKQQFTAIQEACVETATRFHPFTLSIRGTGVFPNPRHPRVLWVGLAGETETLEDLQEQLDERMASIGFEPEEKDFRPHLTIGRLKSNRNVKDLLARADAYSLPNLSFEVGEIVLMKSDLSPAGARYSELAKVKMKAR
jgi:2'-5' RNA ligase